MIIYYLNFHYKMKHEKAVKEVTETLTAEITERVTEEVTETATTAVTKDGIAKLVQVIKELGNTKEDAIKK